jgi:hypothetical protein
VADATFGIQGTMAGVHTAVEDGTVVVEAAAVAVVVLPVEEGTAEVAVIIKARHRSTHRVAITSTDKAITMAQAITVVRRDAASARLCRAWSPWIRTRCL